MKHLIEYINKKFQQKNITPFGLIPNSLTETIKVEKITERMLKEFIGLPVVAKINENYIDGVLSNFKGNFVINGENRIKRSFKIEELHEIFTKNKKISLQEVIQKEEDGYHVRSKKGKNLGGPYESKQQAEKRLKQVEYFKHVNEENLLLRERLKNKFFKITEEIVNKDNKGKLTASRQASRDKIERKLGDVKVVKGPPGRMDTPEEARYRLATFIELTGKKKNKD